MQPLFCGVMQEVVESVEPVPSDTQCPGDHTVDLTTGNYHNEPAILMNAQCDGKTYYQQIEVAATFTNAKRDEYAADVLVFHNKSYRDKLNAERVANPMWQLCSLPFRHDGGHAWEIE